MTPHNITLVQRSWSQVLPIAPQAAVLFYANLFRLDPTLQPLFKGDMAAQGQRLMQMIGAAVSQIDRPEVLLPVLQGLGRRHAGYGVQQGHYATVGTALLQTLARGLGDGFSPEVEAAWTEVYGVIAGAMMTAATAAEPAPAAPLLERIEGQQLIVAALAAAQPQRSVGQDAALQEGVELILDEARQPLKRACDTPAPALKWR